MMFGFFRRRRWRKALAKPFPAEWDRLLEHNFCHWQYLDDEEKSRMRDLIRIFLVEKYWEGAGGLEVTEDMKVQIAAQACLLLLNIEHDFYRALKTILIYPSGYFAPSRTSLGGGGRLTVESTMPVLGQAHYQGPIILSWQHVVQGGRQAHDGHNLVYHEFAHKLDMADGVIDGTPVLRNREQRREWAEVMSREFAELQQRSSQGYWGSALLRPYAATNPAEFFAVATEVFFERPHELRQMHPELYRVLMRFYKQDPAARIDRAMARPSTKPHS